MNKNLFKHLAAIAMLAFAGSAWGVGAPFTAAPDADAHCQNVKLTGAYFVDGKPNREYHFSGTCKAELVPGAKSTDMPFPVIIDASYDTQTKVAYEVVTVTWGGKKLVIIDNSKCEHDPFIHKNNGCSLTNAINPTAFPLNSSDYPMARNRTTEAAAKAASPKPNVPPPPKLDDVQVLAPVANQSYADSVRVQVHVAKHFADDGISCCDLEFQNSVGGNWVAFKTVTDTRVAEPKDLNFSHDWFDISKSSKYRVRARPIKKASYDDTPWSNWVEFFVTGPAVPPGTVPKIPVKAAGLTDNGGRDTGNGSVSGVVANTTTVAPVIKSMEINPVKAKSSEAVTVKVNGTGTCKFHVDFGNGMSTDKEEALPVSFPASFIVSSYETKVFTVKATGQSGCQGSAQASVTIGEPVPAQTTTTLKLNVNQTLFSTTTTTAPKGCPPGKRC